MAAPNERDEINEAVWSLKGHVRLALFYSFFYNALMLVPIVYMMQVYDRVVNSRSHMTLWMLTLITLFLLWLTIGLDQVRGRLLQSAGLALDEKLGLRTFFVAMQAQLRRLGAQGNQALADLALLRGFVSSQALTAFLDAPWSVLFVIIIYLMDPLLGWISITGAIMLVILAFLTEKTTQPALAEANKLAVVSANYANNSLRNAEVIEAMGMLRNLHKRWLAKQNELVSFQALASDRAGVISAVSRFIRLTQGSLLLGVGAWLTFDGRITPGGMIAASILGGRVLAPIEQVIVAWKNVVAARASYGRLNQLLGALPAKEPEMPLPQPKGNIAVENVTAAAPGTQLPIIRGASFQVPAGKVLMLVGPSAAGKSTLARLLVGVWPALSGKVRLDGADVYQWNKTELGPQIGYLPQDIELFDGSFAENIGRFGGVDMDKVMTAARLVGLHEAILEMPAGYDTQIGDEGCFLSGGQRQKLALARAVYGHPRVVVLDEPSSNLDESGEASLVNTLRTLKSMGCTVVVITYSTSILPVADLMMLIRDGQVQMYGPRDEVLAALNKNAQKQAAVPSGRPPLAAQPVA